MLRCILWELQSNYLVQIFTPRGRQVETEHIKHVSKFHLDFHICELTMNWSWINWPGRSTAAGSQIQPLPNSHLTSDHLKKHQNKPPYISTSFPNRTFINVFPLETSTSCVGATKIYICCSSTKTAHLRPKISLVTFCMKTHFWRLKSAKIYSLITKNAKKCRKVV